MAIDLPPTEASDIINRGAAGGPVVIIGDGTIAYVIFFWVQEKRCYCVQFNADHEWCLQFMLHCNKCQYPRSSEHLERLLMKYWPDDETINCLFELMKP